MIRSILVPLDGTEFSEQALPEAMALARKLGARLHLVRVHQPLKAEDVWVGMERESHPPAREREDLERLANELTMTGLPADATLLEGPVPETLAKHVAAVQADLVVMTTHGRGPLGRAFLGSVADALLRQLTAPLLLIRPTDRAQPPAKKRHLLIALDGTPRAEAILPTAVDLGSALESHFLFLRVIGFVQDYVLMADGDAVPYPDEEATKQLAQAAKNDLERLAASWRAKGCDVETRVVLHSDPVTAILEEAHRYHCDLIALESQGRTGLSRLMLGSVEEALVRKGPVPVLTHVTPLAPSDR